MQPHPSVRLPLLLLGLALLGGCSESLEPETSLATDSELTFLRLQADAPEIEDTVVSFWAVRGDSTEAKIRYYYEDTHSYSKCLRFVVPARALLQRPDGTPIAEGDSVRITVRMPDPTRLTFVFEPSGLKFDPTHPARLEVRYRYAERDLNGDGTVDAQEQQVWNGFGFWRQERSGDPWNNILTARDETLAEATAAITGFTQYALASN